MNILFASTKEKPDFWIPMLQKVLPEDRFFGWPDNNGGDIDVAIVATHPKGALAGLPKLKLIQSLWMGVENIVADPDLPKGVPVARLVDPGMVAAMHETVTAHVLDWHRHLYCYRDFQRQGLWKRRRQYLASDRTVGILGLGELGGSIALKLKAMGFNVAGFSRTPKQIDGVHCSTDIGEVLSMSDAAVCLLPLTPQTRGILNRESIQKIREEGCLINLGRGGHVVIPDLIEVLDSGRLAHAYLDVFEPEPLPADSPVWKHPNITLTPHVAAFADPRTSVRKIAGTLDLLRGGGRPKNLVDFAAGY